MGRAKDTAELTAFGRAAGAFERSDSLLKNPDDMAREFLGWRLGFFADLCAVGPLRRLVDRAYERTAPGAARYLLVRTKHFDQLVLDEVEAGAKQLVILGAGYDTRAYRFRDRLANVRVFELDHPDTARRKIQILTKNHGALPTHVAYVAIDFQRESLEARLRGAGYDEKLRTFFLWEGVTYYLAEAAVDLVLRTARDRSGPLSSIAFDYAYRSVVEGGSDAYGADVIRKKVKSLGEPFTFGIEEGKLSSFLAERGFELVSDLGPKALDERYLKGPEGEDLGHVSGFFSIALARKR
jgi:methyltransferase (TIGR00027 family)